ncbi:MAG TPA: Na+/H+ antiporter subunit E [Halanaerobiales bacterium]|nr:Na+/H+ antiporter subunit E [Halanaerobiales bacterium]
MGRKRRIIFILLLVFWLIVSTTLGIPHILIGLFFGLVLIWYWKDLLRGFPDILTFQEFLALVRVLLFLAREIVLSVIAVARTLLFSRPAVSPAFILIEPPLTSDWGRVLLANCITIAPGTTTIDVDPETGRFFVHALTEEIAQTLMYWPMVDKIRDLEQLIQRRTKKED